jgi:hypothetical protein
MENIVASYIYCLFLLFISVYNGCFTAKYTVICNKIISICFVKDKLSSSWLKSCYEKWDHVKAVGVAMANFGLVFAYKCY